ncbi:predicted protein [Postia placenta Mad-698-R]|nr:predicted protein [Postia placenta Mad-698-R]
MGVAADIAAGGDVGGSGSGSAAAEGASNADLNKGARNIVGDLPTRHRTAAIGDDLESIPEQSFEDPWSLCAEQVWKVENALVEKWKEDIGSLLVFDGLFMTILTGFIVAFYPSLHPDPSTEVLLVIAAQLSTMTGQSKLTQQQQASLNDAAATSRPTPWILSTSTLWFSAMICGMCVASIAIAVGQWLHQHLDRPSIMSRRSVLIWESRRRGLQKWEVQFIIDMLPLLLQISMALFLVGLLQLLWSLSYIVAIVATVLVVVLLAPSVCSVFVPAFVPECPYKSRTAWWFFRLVCWLTTSLKWFRSIQLRKMWIRIRTAWAWTAAKFRSLSSRRYRGSSMSATGLRHLCSRIADEIQNLRRACMTRLSAWCEWYSKAAKAANWRELEDYSTRLPTRRYDNGLRSNLIVLAEADQIVMDDSFLASVIHPCFQQSDVDDSVHVLCRILERRAHASVVGPDAKWPTLKWFSSEQDSAATVAMGNLCVDVLAKYDFLPLYSDDVARVVDHLLYLMRAMPPTNSARAVCQFAAYIMNRDKSPWFKWMDEETRSARICDLALGASACFVEHVLPDWLEVVDIETALGVLKALPHCCSYKEDSTRIVLGNIYVDIFRRLPVHHADQNQVWWAIRRCAESMGPESTTGHGWLIDVLMHPGISVNVRVECIRTMWSYWHVCSAEALGISLSCSYYTDVKRFLEYVPVARRELGTVYFLQVLASALELLAHAPQSDLPQPKSSIEEMAGTSSCLFLERAAISQRWTPAYSLKMSLTRWIDAMDTIRQAEKGTHVIQGGWRTSVHVLHI